MEACVLHFEPAEALALMAASAPRFADLQQDRLDRQHKIEELKRETDTKDVEIKALKDATEAIKTELEAECATKDTEIAELKAETDTKDTEIGALKTAATCMFLSMKTLMINPVAIVDNSSIQSYQLLKK